MWVNGSELGVSDGELLRRWFIDHYMLHNENGSAMSSRGRRLYAPDSNKLPDPGCSSRIHSCRDEQPWRL